MNYIHKANTYVFNSVERITQNNPHAIRCLAIPLTIYITFQKIIIGAIYLAYSIQYLKKIEARFRIIPAPTVLERVEFIFQKILLVIKIVISIVAFLLLPLFIPINFGLQIFRIMRDPVQTLNINNSAYRQEKNRILSEYRLALQNNPDQSQWIEYIQQEIKIKSFLELQSLKGDSCSLKELAIKRNEEILDRFKQHKTNSIERDCKNNENAYEENILQKMKVFLNNTTAFWTYEGDNSTDSVNISRVYNLVLHQKKEDLTNQVYISDSSSNMFDNIPNEILISLFSQLNYRNQIKLSSVNKSFFNVIHANIENINWKNLQNIVGRILKDFSLFLEIEDMDKLNTIIHTSSLNLSLEEMKKKIQEWKNQIALLDIPPHSFFHIKTGGDIGALAYFINMKSQNLLQNKRPFDIAMIRSQFDEASQHATLSYQRNKASYTIIPYIIFSPLPEIDLDKLFSNIIDESICTTKNNLLLSTIAIQYIAIKKFDKGRKVVSEMLHSLEKDRIYLEIAKQAHKEKPEIVQQLEKFISTESYKIHLQSLSSDCNISKDDQKADIYTFYQNLIGADTDRAISLIDTLPNNIIKLSAITALFEKNIQEKNLEKSKIILNHIAIKSLDGEQSVREREDIVTQYFDEIFNTVIESLRLTTIEELTDKFNHAECTNLRTLLQNISLPSEGEREFREYVKNFLLTIFVKNYLIWMRWLPAFLNYLAPFSTMDDVVSDEITLNKEEYRLRAGQLLKTIEIFISKLTQCNQEFITKFNQDACKLTQPFNKNFILQSYIHFLHLHSVINTLFPIDIFKETISIKIANNYNLHPLRFCEDISNYIKNTDKADLCYEKFLSVNLGIQYARNANADKVGEILKILSDSNNRSIIQIELAQAFARNADFANALEISQKLPSPELRRESCELIFSIAYQHGTEDILKENNSDISTQYEEWKLQDQESLNNSFLFSDLKNTKPNEIPNAFLQPKPTSLYKQIKTRYQQAYNAIRFYQEESLFET